MSATETAAASSQGTAAFPVPDRVPFLRLLGAVQEPAGPGRVRIRLPELGEDLCNQLPAAHGGVLMALLDAAMSRAAASLPDAPSSTAVTVEMSSRFISPGRGPLVAEGFVVSGGRSLCTCQSEIRDTAGQLVATAMGTFKYWKAPLSGSIAVK